MLAKGISNISISLKMSRHPYQACYSLPVTKAHLFQGQSSLFVRSSRVATFENAKDIQDKEQKGRQCGGPPCIMCVQYIGGCSVHRGDTMSTSGGYHEYLGGIS